MAAFRLVVLCSAASVERWWRRWWGRWWGRRVARARAGAEPARRAPAAPRHARDRHALALRRAHLHAEGNRTGISLVTN